MLKGTVLGSLFSPRPEEAKAQTSHGTWFRTSGPASSGLFLPLALRDSPNSNLTFLLLLLFFTFSTRLPVFHRRAFIVEPLKLLLGPRRAPFNKPAHSTRQRIRENAPPHPIRRPRIGAVPVPAPASSLYSPSSRADQPAGPWSFWWRRIAVHPRRLLRKSETPFLFTGPDLSFSAQYQVAISQVSPGSAYGQILIPQSHQLASGHSFLDHSGAPICCLPGDPM